MGSKATRCPEPVRRQASEFEKGSSGVRAGKHRAIRGLIGLVNEIFPFAFQGANSVQPDALNGNGFRRKSVQ